MTHLRTAVDVARLHKPSYSSIPSQISCLKAFVPYVLLPSERAGGKVRKQAINPRTGKANDWNNPSDYVSLKQAEDLLVSNPKYYGIGICFKGAPMIDGRHLIGIDLDNIYEANGQIKIHHLELLNGLHGFVETSVSGNGRHIFILSNESIGDFKCHNYGVELFSSNAFIALTGDVDPQFNQSLFAKNVDLTVLDRYKRSWQQNYDVFAAESERDPHMSLEELRDLVMSIRPPDAGRATWIKVGMACYHQTRGDLGGLEIWHEWSEQGYEHPEIYGVPASFSDMEYQWHSFRKDPNLGRRLVTHKTLRYWANQVTPCNSIIFEDRQYDLKDSVATEYIIDGFIAEGIFVLAGQSGIGKTTLLLPLAALAAHICNDTHPLKPILHRPVLYLTEDKKQAVRILAGLRKHCDVNMADAEINQRFKIRETHRMSKDEIAKLIRQFAHENKSYMKDINGADVLIPVLIVADTVAATLDLDDENNNSEVSKFISSIKSACADTGASLWLIAHISKIMNRAQVGDMTARGASAFGADANGTGFVIFDDKGDENKRHLILGKKRYEASFNEVSFTTERHEIFVKNRLGQALSEFYRIGLIEKSSETTRRSASQQAQLSRDEKNILDVMCSSGHKYFSKSLVSILVDMPTGNAYQKLGGILVKLVAEGRLEMVAAKDAISDGANIPPNVKEVYRMAKDKGDFEV